jgi:LmbE family N-acetylglucosaminyl deacetylase
MVIRLNKTVVVFAPHPDDETLGCGGTIVKKLASGYDVIVVVMTDGRHALSNAFGILQNPTPEEIKAIRKSEAIEAMQILGVPRNNILFLDFEDGTLARANNHKELILKIDEILDKFQPAEVYFPQEKDHHPDHRAASLLLQESIKKLNYPIKGYQYSVGMRYLHLDPLKEKLLNYLKNHCVYVDISEHLSKKIEALGAYKSQIGIVCSDQEHAVIETTERFLKGKELFYLFNSKRSKK